MESQNIQFEEDYIFRNNRSVTSIPDVALTEFIANAWDAGAYHVDMTIPSAFGQLISVEDDGTGMTNEEFHSRWMYLGYDRRKKQGEYVTFPSLADQTKRKAYGRNGVGRHGMFCFSNCYTVETWRDGLCNKYKIRASSGDNPYIIAEHNTFEKAGHGTKIYTEVERHLPNAQQIKEILSVRFLYDPKFILTINGEHIELTEHSGICYSEIINLLGTFRLEVIMIDSTKTAMKNQQHGIAFWVDGRLVGRPSWSYGDYQFVDGRIKFAKRYTIIIKSDDLTDFILPDWSGFLSIDQVDQFLGELKPYIDNLIKKVMRDKIKDIQFDIIKESRDTIETLNLSGRLEASDFIEEITSMNPLISSDFLKSAIEALAKIQNARNGKLLLQQLNHLTEDDINKLSDILKEWDINDIAAVLNEIDKRIVVIEALERLCNDETVDELHTIHPLVLNARWLFGAQFDSPMFVSNKTLSTVLEELFEPNEYDKTELDNPKRRPDIVCLHRGSIKAVCTERIDNVSGMMKPDQILIIEVKRGGFEIKDNEITQVEYYVRQIKKSKTIHNTAEITAYIVGQKLGDIDEEKTTSSGAIHAVTFAHLIDTAKLKLFKLKDSLKDHYNNFSTETIIDKALKEPAQIPLCTNK